MTKNILVSLCFVILAAAVLPAGQKPPSPGETITRPDATSNDGLKVSGFQLIIRGPQKAGITFTVKFKLTNTTNSPITFSPEFGIFCGCRWNNQNKDFGHASKGKVLGPKNSIAFQAGGSFTAAGHWEFWPAYHVNGHFGPYQWNEIALDITP